MYTGICLALSLRQAYEFGQDQPGNSHMEPTRYGPPHYTNAAFIQPLQLPDPAGSTHYTLQCMHMHICIPNINIHAHTCTYSISTARQITGIVYLDGVPLDSLCCCRAHSSRHATTKSILYSTPGIPTSRGTGRYTNWNLT